MGRAMQYRRLRCDRSAESRQTARAGGSACPGRTHRCPPPPTTLLGLDEYADALHAALDRSVAAAIGTGRRVAVTLSGGLDSRALLGHAAAHTSELRTFTFGTPGCRDVRYAGELAERVGASHTAVEIDGASLLPWIDHGIFVTGGSVSATQFHIAVIADRLAAEADLVLDGLAGDALTGGHLTPGMFAARSPARATELLYRQRATVWPAETTRRDIFEPEFLDAADTDPRRCVEAHVAAAPAGSPWRGCHAFDLRERQRRFVQFGPHQLRPMLDVATPFYSAAGWRLAGAAGPQQLLRQRGYLRMHTRHLPDLAAVPDSARGLPLTSSEALRFGSQVVGAATRRLPYPLRRFLPGDTPPTDYPRWFRGDLREFVRDRLIGGRTCLDGVFRAGAVERIVSEHMLGKADHSHAIGCSLALVGVLDAARNR